MALQTWPIDHARSSIQFSVRHLVIAKVRGRFRRWTADLRVDENDLARSRIDVSIDAASIDTNDEARDVYLRSAEFLEAVKYPNITFKTTEVAPRRNGELALVGDLTIRDVTRSVTLRVRGSLGSGFRGEVSIARQEFGAKWNQALETGGFLVGKLVEVEVELRASAPR